MATVTYKNQPAIHRTRGSVPLQGTDYAYSVKKVLWPQSVETLIENLIVGRSLHICSGRSLIGDVRLDIDKLCDPDVIGDASKLPIKDQSVDTAIIDPPYNGKFQWNHDMLSELSRVTTTRIVWQHWFLPTDKKHRYKKDHQFKLSQVFVWQPKTYFGRVNVIAVIDKQKTKRGSSNMMPPISEMDLITHRKIGRWEIKVWLDKKGFCHSTFRDRKSKDPGFNRCATTLYGPQVDEIMLAVVQELCGLE